MESDKTQQDLKLFIAYTNQIHIITILISKHNLEHNRLDFEAVFKSIIGSFKNWCKPIYNNNPFSLIR